MDDTSYMDTSSDDVDCDIPLSLRIQMRLGAPRSPERAKGPRAEMNKERISWSNERSKSSGGNSSDKAEFRERGCPLSEVINKITSSPSLAAKKLPDRWLPLGGAQSKVQERGSLSQTGQAPGSRKYVLTEADEHSGDMEAGSRYTSDRGEGGKLTCEHSPLKNVSYNLKSSPTQGEHQSLQERSGYGLTNKSMKPFHISSPGKKGLHIGSSLANGHSKRLSWGTPNASDSRFKDTHRNNPGSSLDDHSSPSIHINWDKSGKMQTSGLDSPWSPSKIGKQRSFWTAHRVSPRAVASPSGMPSPILIPDTPLSARSPLLRRSHQEGSDEEVNKSSTELQTLDRKHLQIFGDGTRCGPRAVDSDGPAKRKLLTGYVVSPHHRERISSDAILSSPGEGIRHSTSSVQDKKISSNEIRGRRLQVGEKPFHVKKYSPRKDPVWDYAIEKGDSSSDSNQPKSWSHDKDQSQIGTRQDRRAHGHDDHFKFNKYHRSPVRKSLSPVFSGLTHTLLPSSKSSPTLSSDGHLSPSPGRRNINKEAPKIYSWMSTANRKKECDGQTELHGKSSRRTDIKGGDHTRLKHSVQALLGLFSSDEDEVSESSTSRKRKVEEQVTEVQARDEDTMSKRIKTTRQSPTSSLSSSRTGRRGKSKSKKNRHLSSSLVHSKKHSGMSIPEGDADLVTFSSHATSPDLLDDFKRKDPVHASRAAKQGGKRKGKTNMSTLSSVPGNSDEATGISSLHISEGRAETVPPKSTTRSTSSLRSSPPSSDWTVQKNVPDSSGMSRIRGTPESTVNTPENQAISIIDDNSDDDVVVLDSYSYAASLVDSHSRKRVSHRVKNATNTASPRTIVEGAVGGVLGSVDQRRDTVSPTTLEMFDQLDADEAMARRLQEQFDAEMAQSVQQACDRAPENPGQETIRPNIPTASLGGPELRRDQSMAGSSSHPTSTTHSPPQAGISLSLPSSTSPVRVGSMNWNFDFQPASSLWDQHRSGRGVHPPARGRQPRVRGRGTGVDPHGHDWMMRILEDIEDRYEGRGWMPNYNELPNLQPRHGNRGRGRGRSRRRRRNQGADDYLDGADAREGNDYEVSWLLTRAVD